MTRQAPDLARWSSPLVILILFLHLCNFLSSLLWLFFTFKQPAVFRYSLCSCSISSSSLSHLSFPPLGILNFFSFLVPVWNLLSLFSSSLATSVIYSSLYSGFIPPPFLARDTCFQYFSLEKCVYKRKRAGRKVGRG